MTTTNPTLGCSAQLVPAGANRGPTGVVLRFVLLLEPFGAGTLGLADWPRHAHRLAGSGLRVLARTYGSGAERALTLRRLPPVQTGPALETLVALWTGVMGGAGSFWPELATLLAGTAPPECPPRAALRRDLMAMEAERRMVAAAKAAAAGAPEPVLEARLPEAILRLAAGRGWDSSDPEEEAVRQAITFGEAALARRLAWETAQRDDPDAALALLEPPGPMRLANRDPGAIVTALRVAQRPPEPDPVRLQGAINRGGSNPEQTVPTARRRWGELMSHPSLMRLFGLAWDCEADASALGAEVLAGGGSFWTFRADGSALTVNRGGAPTWSLGKLRGGDQPSFWPCLREEAHGASVSRLSQSEGFANLGEELPAVGSQPVEPRWRVQVDDGTGETFAQSAGASQGETRQSPGLALIDAAPTRDATAGDAALLACQGDAEPILDARLLQTGWQLDIGVTREGRPPLWRSLMGRRIRYVRLGHNPGGLDPEKLINGAYGGTDVGVRRGLAEAAQQVGGVTDYIPGGGAAVLLHDTTLAHWTGLPIGLSLDGKRGVVREGGIIKAGDDQLRISTVQDIPEGVAPPMILGEHYHLRLRAVFRGGVTPPPATGAPAGTTLGPQALHRLEAIGAPTVLHLESDLLREARRVEWPERPEMVLWRLPPHGVAGTAGAAPPPRGREMILHHDPAQPGRPAPSLRRVLLPPNVAAAFADRHGARYPLAEGGRVPRDGLRTVDFAALMGGWPGMRSVGDSTIAIDHPSPPRPGSEPLRGGDGVFRAALPGTKRRLPYYPDPMATAYRVALRWVDAEDIIPGTVVEVPAYPPGATYPDPRPLIIELAEQAAGDASTPKPVVVAGGTLLPIAPVGMAASLVRVALAPGESVEILAWCGPATAAELQQFALWHGMKAPVFEALTRRPVPQLAGVAAILAANPSTRAAAALAPRFRAVAWTDAAETEQVPFAGSLEAPLRRLSGIRVLARGTAIVSGRFDDPEAFGRSAARRTEAWPINTVSQKAQSAEEIFGFRIAPDGQVSFQAEEAEVLAFDGPVPPAAPGGAAVSEVMVKDFTASLPAALRDGKARTIHLRPLGLPGGAALAVDRHGEPLDRFSLPAAGPAVPVPIPATRRPDPVVRPWAVPSFDWIQKTPGADGWHALTRRTAVRIRVARPWFSSGEDERIGVVLWPPHLFELQPADVERDEFRRPLADAPPFSLRLLSDLDLGPGGAFVTRWGGDPIRETPERRGLLLSCDSFAEAGGAGWSLRDRVRMPLPRVAGEQANAVPETLCVALLAAEPRFDPDLEQWWADLPVSVAGAAEPFLRIGLVRWQGLAPEALRCSEPASVWTRLLPERELRWRMVRADGRMSVQARVHGPARHVATEAASAVATAMTFYLSGLTRLPDGGVTEQPIGLVRPGWSWERLDSEAAPPAACEGCVAPQDQLRRVRPVWTAEMPIDPAQRGFAQYRLTAVETEYAPAATPPDVGTVPLVESGARYLASVEVAPPR